MSTQPFEQVLEVCRQTMAGVTADQLQNPSPCASWDVAGVINHMVGGQNFFRAGMEGTPPAEDDTNWSEGDFVAAFDAAGAQTLAAFQVEGAMQKTVSLPFGDMPGAGLMGLAMTDSFQHAWDLAKATGQSTDLAPELATALLAQSKQMIQENFRGPEGAPFGAQQECAEDACAADQLAAFLGRTV